MSFHGTRQRSPSNTTRTDGTRRRASSVRNQLHHVGWQLAGRDGKHLVASQAARQLIGAVIAGQLLGLGRLRGLLVANDWPGRLSRICLCPICRISLAFFCLFMARPRRARPSMHMPERTLPERRRRECQLPCRCLGMRHLRVPVRRLSRRVMPLCPGWYQSEAL
jgi:hypothetical protein